MASSAMLKPLLLASVSTCSSMRSWHAHPYRSFKSHHVARRPRPQHRLPPHGLAHASANNKLAKIPVTRHGKVLLMHRFELDTGNKNSETNSGINDVFHDGISHEHANKVKEMFPFRKVNMGRRNPSVIIA